MEPTISQQSTFFECIKAQKSLDLPCRLQVLTVHIILEALGWFTLGGHIKLISPPVAEWSRRAYPAPLEAGGVGSNPANSDAQHVPSLRRWRFEVPFALSVTHYRCCTIFILRFPTFLPMMVVRLSYMYITKRHRFVSFTQNVDFRCCFNSSPFR